MPTNVDESHSAKISIYADDVKVYESEFMNRKNKALDFDVDIAQAESIRVEVYTDDLYGHTRMHLVDAYVYNKMSE